MSQIAVVYWSGTGHTQAMAEAVAKACGAQLFTAEEFSADQVAKYDAIAFGCPAMGAEVLEESEFQPMFDVCRAKRSRCSAPMAGATANGCAAGKRTASPPARRWLAAASSARMIPTTARWPSAKRWARRCNKHFA